MAIWCDKESPINHPGKPIQQLAAGVEITICHPVGQSLPIFRSHLSTWDRILLLNWLRVLQPLAGTGWRVLGGARALRSPAWATGKAFLLLLLLLLGQSCWVPVRHSQGVERDNPLGKDFLSLRNKAKTDFWKLVSYCTFVFATAGALSCLLQRCSAGHLLFSS